jgi:hypothetical protein
VDALIAFWERVTAQQPQPAVPESWLAVAVAAAVVLLPFSWRLARHAITIAHEAGHALVATLTGRRLSGIRLHSDTSGVTVSRGRPRGPAMIATLLAGYTAPAVLGLMSAWLLGAGYATAVLWALLLALVLVLVQVRNWFGLWSVLVTGALVFAATWLLDERWRGLVATAVVAFLLLGAVRTVIELQRVRRGGHARNSDADQLARLSHVPGPVWVGVFFLVATVCVVLGGAFLGLTPLPRVAGFVAG